MPLFFVLSAQFLSAFADNALLFAAIAVVKADGYPAWFIPALHEFFVQAFVLFAPFVGPIADGFPKGRIMMASNLVKLFAAGLFLAGVNPFLAYAVAGTGAAFYSPAKYSILSEMLPAEKLVAANGLMEGSTILAILIGALAGGLLADRGVDLAFGVTALVYVAAALLNLGIPRLAPAHRLTSLRPNLLVKKFFAELVPLWKDPVARLSLLGTSIFWGSGAALRFLLVAWVPFALHLTSNAAPAALNAATALGVVLGAAWASWKIPLARSHRILPLGIGLGLAVLALAGLDQLWLAVPLLVLIGALGGALVVPLNALLQWRGQALGTPGHAVAVQNLFENIAMLLALLMQSLVDKSGANPSEQALLFGALVMVLIGVLMGAVRKQRLAVEAV